MQQAARHASPAPGCSDELASPRTQLVTGADSALCRAPASRGLTCGRCAQSRRPWGTRMQRVRALVAFTVQRRLEC